LGLGPLRGRRLTTPVVLLSSFFREGLHESRGAPEEVGVEFTPERRRPLFPSFLGLRPPGLFRALFR